MHLPNLAGAGAWAIRGGAQAHIRRQRDSTAPRNHREHACGTVGVTGGKQVPRRLWEKSGEPCGEHERKEGESERLPRGVADEVGRVREPQQPQREEALLQRLGQYAVLRCRQFGKEHKGRVHHAAVGKAGEDAGSDEPRRARREKGRGYRARHQHDAEAHADEPTEAVACGAPEEQPAEVAREE